MIQLKSQSLAILILVSLLITSACGDFQSQRALDSQAASSLQRQPFGTCDRKNVTTVNLCMEVVGVDYNEAGYLDILRSSCESSGGTFSTNICDSTTSAGTCVVHAGLPNTTYVSYYPPQYTPSSARAACEATPGGTPL